MWEHQNLFLTYMQRFTLQDIKRWTGVVQIIMHLLRFDSQSDGTHSLQEDQLLSKWCNAKFLQICSDEDTNSSTSWMTLGWVHF